MRIVLLIGTAFWLIAAVTGTVVLTRYGQAPQAAGAAYPEKFPNKSRIELNAEGNTLLMFAHPKCPCTRASVHELARLMSDTGGKLKAFVIFAQPPSAPSDWCETSLRSSAAEIPNVTAVIDEGEVETGRFGARISGTTLVYGQDGELRFQGGITSARGIEGPSAGNRAIFDLITRDPGLRAEAPVFGCPLFKHDCAGEMVPASSEVVK